VLGSAIVAISGFLYLLPLGVPGLIATRLLLGAGRGRRLHRGLGLDRRHRGRPSGVGG
jgi:hypothetical protein